MDDEKDGRGKPGIGKPSISQAELDALIGQYDLDQKPSVQNRPVRPVVVNPKRNFTEDVVAGDGMEIDQSELDALLAGQDDNELFADTPVQANGASEGAGLSQAELDALLGGDNNSGKSSEPAAPAKGASAERVLSQEEIDAMLAALGN